MRTVSVLIAIILLLSYNGAVNIAFTSARIEVAA